MKAKFQSQEYKSASDILETYQFTLFGGRANWSIPGTITIYEGLRPDYYLEASITLNDKVIPFYSITVNVDQWGTFYDFCSEKWEDSNQYNSHIDVAIAQEWGKDSYMVALSKAMAKLADISEPDKDKYLAHWNKSEKK